MFTRGKRRSRKTRGFTLMEVLLVLVILVILGSLAGIAIRSARKTALENSAKAQIGMFESALELYEGDVRSFPSTSQGLQALIEQPSDLKSPDRWKSRYLEKVNEIPADPWDNPYQYEFVGQDEYPRIWSLGPDGVDNTEDDISNK